MFLTGSRTSAVAFIVVVAILWLTVPQLRKWTIPGLFVIAVFLHFAFPGAIGMLLERLSPGFLISTETGNQAGRVADYARIMEYFHLRPLLGLGFGSFNPFRYFWLDNEYLKLLAEVGLLGLLAFITFFASGFLRLYRTGRAIGGEVGSLAIAVSASVAVFAVTTFTYDSFGFPQAFNLFFILLGLGLALASVAREDNEFESESVRGFSAGTGVLARAPDRSHRPIDRS
jgi:O-antigen ligase